MILHRFVNSICASNTYVFFPDVAGPAWVVDPGDAVPVLGCLREAGRDLAGILVTHSHHDHIYGITEVQREFPGAKVFAAEASVPGLFSAKLNMSRYHLRPFSLAKQEVVALDDGARIPFTADADILVIETPGHHPGSVSFAMLKELFTGDSLLPGSRVTTVLPGGDREVAKQSVSRLLSTFSRDTRVHPGHGDTCELGAVDFELLFRRPSSTSGKLTC